MPLSDASTFDLELKGDQDVVAEFTSATTARSWYHYVLLAACVVFAAVSVGFVGSILQKAFPTFVHHSSTILTGSGWQSPAGPVRWSRDDCGTLETSLIALVIAVLIGLGTAISIVFFIPRRLRNIVATFVEPLGRGTQHCLWTLGISGPGAVDVFDRRPLVKFVAFCPCSLWRPEPRVGPSLLLAAVVLGVMILPTFVAISREVIAVVPQNLVEASLSLGATKWQVIRRVVLPTSRIGFFGATFLALAARLARPLRSR